MHALFLSRSHRSPDMDAAFSGVGFGFINDLSNHNAMISWSTKYWLKRIKTTCDPSWAHGIVSWYEKHPSLSYGSLEFSKNRPRPKVQIKCSDPDPVSTSLPGKAFSSGPLHHLAHAILVYQHQVHPLINPLSRPDLCIYHIGLT